MDGIETLTDQLTASLPPFRSKPSLFEALPEDCQCVNGGVCQKCYDDIWDVIGKAEKE